MDKKLLGNGRLACKLYRREMNQAQSKLEISVFYNSQAPLPSMACALRPHVQEVVSSSSAPTPCRGGDRARLDSRPGFCGRTAHVQPHCWKRESMRSASMAFQRRLLDKPGVTGTKGRSRQASCQVMLRTVEHGKVAYGCAGLLFGARVAPRGSQGVCHKQRRHPCPPYRRDNLLPRNRFTLIK